MNITQINHALSTIKPLPQPSRTAPVDTPAAFLNVLQINTNQSHLTRDPVEEIRPRVDPRDRSRQQRTTALEAKPADQTAPASTFSVSDSQQGSSSTNNFFSEAYPPQALVLAQQLGAQYSTNFISTPPQLRRGVASYQAANDLTQQKSDILQIGQSQILTKQSTSSINLVA